MPSKIIYSPKIFTTQFESDLTCLRRLLVAACINSDFCGMLLKDPRHSVQMGFGGERFVLSEGTLETLSTIHAKTLPEFIQTLHEKIPILSA